MEKHIEIIERMMFAMATHKVDGIRIMPTLKAAKEAFKKQIPKKFKLWNGNCCCPTCNKLFGPYTVLKKLIHWEMPYCKYCGQALDWSDTE